MEDFELIEKARNGDSNCAEELFTRYKPLAKKISRKFFLAGQDSDDIFQEAMIGLFKAYQGFKISEQTDFKSFASLCITRQILSAIKTANRQKNKILSEAVSLNNQGGFQICVDDEEENFYFVLPSKEQAPDDELISQENVEEMLCEINKLLSDFEKQVLKQYLKGYSIKQISVMLEKSPKSVDNAITRLKSKLTFLKN